jgi:hypothetical protein
VTTRQLSSQKTSGQQQSRSQKKSMQNYKQLQQYRKVQQQQQQQKQQQQQQQKKNRNKTIKKIASMYLRIVALHWLTYSDLRRVNEEGCGEHFHVRRLPMGEVTGNDNQGDDAKMISRNNISKIK